MRLRSILTAALGLGVAAYSATAARDYFEAQADAKIAAAESKVVDVVAASVDIPFGSVIEPRTLTTIKWPREAIPKGTFQDIAMLAPNASGEPRRAKRAISQGELILAAKVSEHGEKVTIVQKLGENTRAMALNVNAQSGVAGFVTPGDRVDITMIQGGGAGMRAITILQNIQVIGVDQTSNEQTDQPIIARTVTVEVTPEQGQMLALAQRAGQLSLSLRSPDETVAAPLESVQLRDLIREEAPVETIKKPTVLVRRGITSVETVEINNKGERVVKPVGDVAEDVIDAEPEDAALPDGEEIGLDIDAAAAPAVN